MLSLKPEGSASSDWQEWLADEEALEAAEEQAWKAGRNSKRKTRPSGAPQSYHAF